MIRRMKAQPGIVPRPLQNTDPILSEFRTDYFAKDFQAGQRGTRESPTFWRALESPFPSPTSAPQIISSFQNLGGVVRNTQGLLTHSLEINLLSLSFLICQMEKVARTPTDFLRLEGNMNMKGSCQQLGY